ncbi:hypothetical protein B0J12DRAFT_660371 [Macrophomina phaseolina]|uniref:LDB19 N-terminal domain-containing protein n=1 Tax=Macrophomina phaseolina TaxID=35725 RepID=A0ABQ8GCI0_9PEZI|nr:hypothetical protein B0J12DRAFT_660371 [Macrophomina phaseolina]
MLQLIRSTVHNPHCAESRPAEIVASDIKGFPKGSALPARKMHLRIPKSPLTVIGDPDQASSVPLAGHVEVVAKPIQQADIASIQLSLVRTTKIKKAAAKTQEALLAPRRRSFGNRSPTRDKRTCVEELMQWTITYSPCHLAENNASTTMDSKGTKQNDRRGFVPFNIQIPGHLRATTSTPLGSTTYTLTAAALSKSTGKPLFTTETPLHIQRTLHLPNGPAEVVLRRRFPDSSLSTRLTLPGVLSPTASFPAKLTLCNTVTRRGRTATHLCIRRLDWRIEERTSVVSAADASADNRLPLFSELESGVVLPDAQRRENGSSSSSSSSTGNTHTRKLAAGKWDGVDKLPTAPTPDAEVDVSFNVALPASARAACGVEPEGVRLSSGSGDAADDRPALAVKHVLVLELITVELKYSTETGELVNMYPFPQRKFGAVYDINVSNWDYGGGARAPGAGDAGASAVAAVQQQPTTMIAIPPCAELLGEMPPSYDSVAVM